MLKNSFVASVLDGTNTMSGRKNGLQRNEYSKRVTT